MTQRRTQLLAFRRKRLGVTNYKKRLQLLLSQKNRFIVRRTLKSMLVQFAAYETKGDKIIVTAHGADIKKLGWGFQCDSVPAAYLIGYVAGKKAVKANIKEAVLDLGLYPSNKGSRIYAALKGAIDAGVKIPCNESMFPSEDRLKGEHIKAYAASAKGNQFAAYKKEGNDPSTITKKVEEIKAKIQ